MLKIIFCEYKKCQLSQKELLFNTAMKLGIGVLAPKATKGFEIPIPKKVFLEGFEEALREHNTDAEVWEDVVCYFIHDKKEHEKCLIALEHLEASLRIGDPEQWNTLGYCVKAWQGHMLDLNYLTRNHVLSL